jgi:CubicO group peptidase (beta-lactamase class C family)
MKELIIYAILFSITLFSCVQNKDTSSDNVLINSIENNLLPELLIEGEKVDAYNILERMEHYNVPGVSIAFLDKGKILWARGYGYADVEKQLPVDEKTLFEVASISKPVAAMAALYLVEQGKLGLDDDVNQFLKDWKIEENEFTSEEKVTLRRILSHSAGLTVTGFEGYAKSDTVPDIIQVLKGEKPANSGRIYPDVKPGSICRYSGGGYTVMQKMLTDITGQGFPELMDEFVLSKINMESSTYEQLLPEDMYSKAAQAYQGNGSVIPGEWHTYPEMAAAGLWTTPTDLLKYASEVYKSYRGESNKVLSQDMIMEMLTPQINSQGLGPNLGGDNENITFGHFGANAGYRCQLFIYTLTGQGIAVMTNSENGGALINEIMRSFSKVLDWPHYRPVTKSVLPRGKEELDYFAGRYLLNLGDQDLIIRLSVKEGYLEAFQEWDNFEFKIYPEAENQFFGLHEGVPLFEFVEGDGGRLERIIVQEGSQVYHFNKIN